MEGDLRASLSRNGATLLDVRWASPGPSLALNLAYGVPLPDGLQGAHVLAGPRGVGA
jgi:hypothetical protein